MISAINYVEGGSTEMSASARAKEWAEGVLGLAIVGAFLWFAPGWCARIAEESRNSVYRINSPAALGCVELADMKRLEMLRSDRVAYYVHHARLRDMGRCIFFKGGEELVVERYSGARQLYLARRVGDPTSLWIPKEFVNKEIVATSQSK